MVMTAQMIGIAFKLINFMLVLGVIGYVFRKYLLPGIQKELSDYDAYLAGLRRSLQLLQNDVHVTQKAIESDAVVQERLKERAQQWHTVVHTQRDELMRERQTRAQQLVERHEKYGEQIALYGSYKRLVPEVIDQVRADLSERFLSPEKQKQFIAMMLRDLLKQ